MLQNEKTNPFICVYIPIDKMYIKAGFAQVNVFIKNMINLI